MAIKTNYEKNGKKYYRITATIGKTSEGKPIRKEFYGKLKSETLLIKKLCGQEKLVRNY